MKTKIKNYLEKIKREKVFSYFSLKQSIVLVVSLFSVLSLVYAAWPSWTLWSLFIYSASESWYRLVWANILDNSITTSEIQNGTIANIDLEDNSVNSAKIENGTILEEDVWFETWKWKDEITNPDNIYYNEWKVSVWTWWFEINSGSLVINWWAWDNITLNWPLRTFGSKDVVTREFVEALGLGGNSSFPLISWNQYWFWANIDSSLSVVYNCRYLNVNTNLSINKWTTNNYMPCDDDKICNNWECIPWIYAKMTSWTWRYYIGWVYSAPSTNSIPSWSIYPDSASREKLCEEAWFDSYKSYETNLSGWTFDLQKWDWSAWVTVPWWNASCVIWWTIWVCTKYISNVECYTIY